MPQPLVIVESPAKARTIARFLGSGFVVESSIGHIRDLPRNADDVPAAFKGESWARLGVDTDNDFKPLYVVSREKTRVVANLKKLLKQASELYLATDEDREGESIAWHLLEVLSPPEQMPVKRMVFHEITPNAIRHAVDNWRELDRRLVDAQEARRILDRLYGYEVSPVLWKKVMPKLSAGRVQSVATRIVVERERARMRFRPAGWWDVEATVERDGHRFDATLVALDGTRLATGKDFDENGVLAAGRNVVVLDEPKARRLVEAMAGASLSVSSVEEKPYRRSPSAPFMTSTLQQEAGRKLRFSSQRAMRVAQGLYEKGYITYMRTDSISLSETAVAAARDQATRLYGPESVPAQPRRYTKKVKNAQEAHEAIRPAGDTFRLPEELARELNGDEQRLYDMIWKRTVASQMADARGHSVQVRISGDSADQEEAVFAAAGKVIEFPGFLRAYVEGSDDPDAELEEREVRLPALTVGDALDTVGLEAKGHTTQPPARFTEASLVKALEELGVGRPSTYAQTIATIQDRGYVWKKGSALVPSFVAFAVVGLLERHFGDLVDYAFTARMEDSLDDIANGDEEAVPWLSRFYFGSGNAAGGLKANVQDRLESIDARAINSIPIGVDSEGIEIIVRVGRYGPYLQRGDQTARLADDMAPDEITVEKATELLSAPSGDRSVGTDPDTGLEVLVRAGRFGPYVQLGEAEGGSSAKPRTSSLLKDMSVETVTLEDALRLLSIPRILGSEDGEEVVVNNGRYGPYIQKGTESRSLESEDQLFTVTMEEAKALLAEPKRRRGQSAAAPLRELGTDPVSTKPVVVKSGRFGPYVTDGETNASLRRGDEVETITIERASELLGDRRAQGPAKSAKPKKVAKAKKAAASKKSTKPRKAAPKKATAKKSGVAKKAVDAKTSSAPA